VAKRDSKNIAQGRSRQQTLAVLVGVLALVLLVRLFDLQVTRHEEFSRFAKDNQLQRQRVVAPRGYIRDRNGRILVDNVLHFEVTMSWRTRNDVYDVVDRLGRYIPLDTTKVMSRFDAWKVKNQRLAFPLVPDADKFVISFIRENADLFPSLRVESRARRRYRGGEFAAHVLGYVGEANDQDVTREGAGRYFPGDMVGRAALERHLESELRGTDGQRVMEVNASGTVLGEVRELSIPPIAGSDVYLTLDATLQEYLEERLGQVGVGAAVAINVEDGSIIAAASVPQYDPNEFATGISQRRLDLLFKSPQKPLFNRIGSARYPPGSIFKIVSTQAILTNHLVDPNKILVYCTGAHQFGNRSFRCWLEGGHGAMNLKSALIQSCDVYYYKVAEIMDVNTLAASARAFGFGRRTEVDMPGEVNGLVPDREYYDEKFGKRRWTQGHMLNNVIGQGEYLVTVLQVARTAAVVGNGGYLVRPHIVDHFDGEPRISYPRKHVPGMVGPTLRFIQAALEGVVSNPRGTAHWTQLSWMKTAGKTGTAENPHGEPHAWYTAYAPAEDPEIAIAILIENKGHGGEFAAPIARDFFTVYFRGIEALRPQAVAAPADSAVGAANGTGTGGMR